MSEKKKSSKKIESKYDSKRLRKLILEGKSADEIQEELEIVSKQSLRQHVMRLINDDMKFYKVPGLYVRGAARPMINFKGELRLTKKMLDFPESTYSHNDEFEIDINNERIILNRIEVNPDEETSEEVASISGDSNEDQEV